MTIKEISEILDKVYPKIDQQIKERPLTIDYVGLMKDLNSMTSFEEIQKIEAEEVAKMEKMIKKMKLNSEYFPYAAKSFRLYNEEKAKEVTNFGKISIDIETLPSNGRYYSFEDFYTGIIHDEPKGKQIFCEIDPYGEESWED
jgi:hypothetical protein